MTAAEFTAWRERMRWAQQAAATALGLNLRTVQRYEKSPRPVPVSVGLGARWIEAERKLREIIGGERE